MVIVSHTTLGRGDGLLLSLKREHVQAEALGSDSNVCHSTKAWSSCGERDLQLRGGRQSRRKLSRDQREVCWNLQPGVDWNGFWSQGLDWRRELGSYKLFYFCFLDKYKLQKSPVSVLKTWRDWIQSVTCLENLL